MKVDALHLSESSKPRAKRLCRGTKDAAQPLPVRKDGEEEKTSFLRMSQAARTRIHTVLDRRRDESPSLRRKYMFMTSTNAEESSCAGWLGHAAVLVRG